MTANPARYTRAELRLARVYGRAAGLDRAMLLLAAYCRSHYIGPERLHALLGILESCKPEPVKGRRERAQTLTRCPPSVGLVPPCEIAS